MGGRDAHGWLVIALTLAGGVGCGGRLWTVDGPGSDASNAGDDANANGGGSSGVGGGSSGGFAGGSSSGGSSSGFGGSSGGSSGGGAFACRSSADCAPGQVCCGGIVGTSPGTACGGPCPTVPIVETPVQLCATSAECVSGTTGGAPTGIVAMFLTNAKVCNYPPNGTCAATCTGCCDGAGICYASGSHTVCGLRGAACTDCTDAGAVCQSGTCTHR